MVAMNCNNEFPEFSSVPSPDSHVFKSTFFSFQHLLKHLRNKLNFIMEILLTQKICFNMPWQEIT